MELASAAIRLYCLVRLNAPSVPTVGMFITLDIKIAVSAFATFAF